MSSWPLKLADKPYEAAETVLLYPEACGPIDSLLALVASAVRGHGTPIHPSASVDEFPGVTFDLGSRDVEIREISQDAGDGGVPETEPPHREPGPDVSEVGPSLDRSASLLLPSHLRLH